MPVKNETSTRFMDEIRIISPWAFFFAIFPFLAAIAAVVNATLSGHPPMPFAAMVALAIVGGTILGCYILLIGYVNRDAGRRGMSRLAWTLLAIFIPNALGIVLYFVLRKPRIATCPQCGALLEPGFGFCPRCRYQLNPVCPHCQRAVHAGNKFCPYCGGDLGAGANEVVTSAGSAGKSSGS
jgi:RNA polymerase subunit RPABC4/transcription elongation factor Spt4